MASLNKTNNGLLFYDDFSEKTLMWTLSPSDANCLSFGDNGLQINHTRRYVTYTIVEPSTEDYSCVIQLDHIPAKVADIAGIIVMSNAKDYAECQSYFATSESEIVNSEIQETELETMIHHIMDEDYVRWSDNDNENLTGNYVIDENGNTFTTVERIVHSLLDPSYVRWDDSEEDSSEPIIIPPTSGFVDEIYQYIKFTKTKYKYIFYASVDGSIWIEIGNVKFENSGVIGFFLYGTDDIDIINKSHCFFNNFAIYNSKYITIEGVDRQYEMEIYDANNNVILRTDNIQFAHMISRSNKTCVINTTTMPTPIKNSRLRIYSKTNYDVTINEFLLGETVYGGDGFALEPNIELFINNTKINQSQIYELGEFYRGSYFIKLDIHNSDEYILSDVKIKVIRYSEYYGGEEEVSIAVHSDDILPNNLFYQKEVIIGRINPSEGKSIYLKLLDKPVQDFYMTANSYRFKIIIE